MQTSHSGIIAESICTLGDRCPLHSPAIVAMARTHPMQPALSALNEATLNASL